LRKSAIPLVQAHCRGEICCGWGEPVYDRLDATLATP